MGLDVYRRYVGEEPEELEKNLSRIVLSSAYLAIEQRAPHAAAGVPEKFESGRDAARELRQAALEHGVPVDGSADRLAFQLRESFGYDVAERLAERLLAPVAEWDILGAIELIERRAPDWHEILRRVFDAKDEMIELKNQRLAEICDVHIGELKVISTFKSLSNGKLYDKRTEIESLLRRLV